MFTIKHIDSNGNEFAIEAASYAVRHERTPGKPDFIRVLTYDTLYQGNDYTGLWAGVATTGRLSTETIFVMNRNGATIAKINFDPTPADYWGEQEPTAMQADPEKLAA